VRTSLYLDDGDRRLAFTLIELVAALVLLSVLMVALTGLIPRFTQRPDDAAAQARSELQHTARMLVDRLARDLSAAESAVLDHRALALRIPQTTPPVGRDTGTSDVVRYAVEERAQRPCVVRVELGQTELLCCGAFRLEIQSLADDGTSSAISALDAGAAPTGTTEIPLASWLELAVTDGSGNLLARTSVIREPASSALLQVYEERR